MKEFYFLRHGQTDLNISRLNDKIDHPADTPLNNTGRNQAAEVRPIISELPIKIICCSPMLRAVQTKEILALSSPEVFIDDLSECNAQIWTEMRAGKDTEVVKGFLSRVKRGLDHALTHEGPVLIVAHGGIHFAICNLLNIDEHNWSIDNCVPVRFTSPNGSDWRAEKYSRFKRRSGGLCSPPD